VSENENDIVIVGAGLAGLFCALKLAPRPVTVIAAKELGEGTSSSWAQGGIAAAVGEGDTPDAHAQDTIAAGDGLVDAEIAKSIVTEAPDRIRDLLSYGVPFDRDLEGHYVLSREAAHSARRVVKVAGDRAGYAIMQALIATARQTRSISFLEGYVADELITSGDGPDARVTGVHLTNPADPGARYMLTGIRALILATGGIGGLYRLTTNPASSRGDGLALGARAGAVVADAEFVQFHPTAIDIDEDPAPLATEALRGEGATLIDETGRRFMTDVHPDAELAPRSVVARAVFEVIAKGGKVFLDCTDAVGDAFAERFPTVYEKCMNAGIDPARQPIPIAPSEHYHMGGLKTGPDARTTLPGLWAIGEVTATGLHGANRLASNSLLEAVVMAARAVEDITATVPDVDGATTRLERHRAAHLPDQGARSAALAMIRETMSANVGVLRDAAGLNQALETLGAIEDAADGDRVIANAALAARFIAEAALRRKETRGAHVRTDFPETDPAQARPRTMTLAGLDLRRHLLSGELIAAIAAGTDTLPERPKKA
jgi:L-aspartate oxidase